MMERVPQFLESKKATIESFLRFTNGQEMPRYPLTLFMEVSNLCNLKCAMCVTFSGVNPHRVDIARSRERGFIQFTEESMKALEEALPHLLLVNCFGYGEPTLHPQFRNVIEKISANEVLIDFFTNGMRMDDALIETLVVNHVFRVTFSFSGANREDYENVYLGGDYDKVLKAIHKLSKYKILHSTPYPRIIVNTIAFRHNLDHFDRFVELMANHGVNEIELKPLQQHEILPPLAGHDAKFDTDARKEVLARAQQIASRREVRLWIHPLLQTGDSPNNSPVQTPISELPRLAQQNKSEGHVLRSSKDPVVPSDATPEEIKAHLDMQTLAPNFVCSEPFQTMYLTQGGRVRPCCFWPDHSITLGSIDADSQSLVKLWQSPVYRSLREGAMLGQYSKKGCGSCIQRQLAPADNYPWYAVREYLKWHHNVFGSTVLDKFSNQIDESIGCRTAVERYRIARRSYEEKNQISLV